MNKLLFQKVKDQCKDTGLSEECLKALTEAIGGSIEDDSTDEEAIGKVANQIKQVAVSTQSEAARWANNKKDPKNKKDQKKQKPANKDGEGDDDDDDPDGDQDPPQNTDNQVLELLKKLEKRMDQFEVDGKTKDRQKLIKEAMENHKIPAKFRDRLAKSIGDDEDIEETVKAFKQDFITEGLTSEGEQKNKTATEQQVDEAADALLKSITVE
jgi:hypothetical protein